MNCATHPANEAIGVCSNCGRGVCAVCAESGPHKVACSPQCAAETAARDVAISAVLAKTNRGSRATGIYSVVAGSGFTLLGLYHALFDRHGVLIALGFGLGITLIILGITFMRIAQRNK